MKAFLVTARLVVILLLLIYVGEMAVKRAIAKAISQIDTGTVRQPQPGIYDVKSLMVTWRDDARDRDVPVKIYWSVAGEAQDADEAEAIKGPLPMLMFSHGLGGSREMYAYLGEYWASNGFIVVHVQHHGSDDALWRNNARPTLALKAAMIDRVNASNRPKDISFAIDQMLKLNGEKDSPFFGKVDESRIGAAGHSFGAYTVLALAGQGSDQSRLVKKVMGELRDERIKAIIPMSAPVNTRAIEKNDFRAKLYGPIDLPIFHMTGTRDNSSIGGASAIHRRIPFDGIEHNDGYLLIFKDGDHMVFSGRRRNAGRSPVDDPEAIVPGQREGGLSAGDPGSARTILQRDAAQHALIETSSLAFWRAYLLGDAKAKAWLQGKGFEKVLGDEGTFEMKVNRK